MIVHDYYACGTRFAYYECLAGEGEPTHIHAAEDHAILVVRGKVSIFTAAGNVLRDGPSAPVGVPAGLAHGFTAITDAVVLTIFANNPALAPAEMLDSMLAPKGI